MKRLFDVALILAVAVMVAVEGTYGFGLFRHWTFVSLMILLMLSLCYQAVSDWKEGKYVPLLSHLGLSLVILGGLAGSLDDFHGEISVSRGSDECMAYEENGDSLQLPFSVRLKEFRIDYYEDGSSPKQYSSTVFIDGREFTTGVNHPFRYRGYRFYQYSYDDEDGMVSVLLVVHDRWLPVLAVGAILLVLAAFAGLKVTWRSWKMLVAALVLATAFTLLSIARISFGTLMPALRSLWFIPHIIIYMLAYAVLALAVIFGIISCITPKMKPELSGRLLSTSSSLLLVGMICGAFWAQQAWGDYWTWDAKECWAAATWLLTLAGTHVSSRRRAFAVTLTILSFLAMQITWYGVNYLPSSDQSMHTYK
ncbi:MAG: cytochrome c biogenesis protein ResB [Bacteroidaceae bacterium]|nr:cytochrome c biogenesis protein ResB [Bacteroidaceae bacterium]